MGGGAGAEARTPEGKVPLLTPILGGGSPGARPWKPGWDSRWRGGGVVGAWVPAAPPPTLPGAGSAEVLVAGDRQVARGHCIPWDGQG